MSSITLPKVVEAMTNGLSTLTHRVAEHERQIKEHTEKRDALLLEIGATERALGSLMDLQVLLGDHESAERVLQQPSRPDALDAAAFA